MKPAKRAKLSPKKTKRHENVASHTIVGMFKKQEQKISGGIAVNLGEPSSSCSNSFAIVDLTAENLKSKGCNMILNEVTETDETSQMKSFRPASGGSKSKYFTVPGTQDGKLHRKNYERKERVCRLSLKKSRRDAHTSDGEFKLIKLSDTESKYSENNLGCNAGKIDTNEVTVKKSSKTDSTDPTEAHLSVDSISKENTCSANSECEVADSGNLDNSKSESFSTDSVTVQSLDSLGGICNMKNRLRESGCPDSIPDHDSAFSSQVTDLLSSQSSSSQGDEEDVYRVPYYLENFMIILNCVLKDEFFSYLFNTEDQKTIDAFQDLTESAQKLYVRLFGRQYRWIRKQKIIYPKILEDLTSVLDELVKSELLNNEENMIDIQEVVETLPAPDLKILGKSLRLSAVNSPRPILIEAVMKHSRGSHIGQFFSKASTPTASTILCRARSLLGACYKLQKEPRSVFMRIMMLFGLHRTRGDDDETGAGQQQLFQMLMSNIGRVKYPEYSICRQSRVFRERDTLLQFSQALQLESDLSEALEHKDYTSATALYTEAKLEADRVLADQTAVKHDVSLPEHLRCYTTGAVYIHILSYGVELLQFTKQYTDAVNQLEQLLKQRTYRQDCRGAWYDRLALNLDYHLKKPDQALDVIQNAMSDKRVRSGHRYALLQRAMKICQSVSNKKLKKRLVQFADDGMNKLIEADKVTIKARRLPQHIAGTNSVFISPDCENEDGATVLLRVEEFALAHYRREGYPEGIHGEGGTFRSLLGMLMWDVIFMPDIPDAFYHLYQTQPLDLTTDAFYENRKEAFDTRLNEIRKATNEELAAMIQVVWDLHECTLCLGLSWDRFTNMDHAVGLARCLGGAVLAGIFERLGKDLRHTRSGLPDLVVWNPQTHKVRVVEVKGPGDRLSTKQILWLDHLIRLGVTAEVCHVEAVGAKKLH